MTFGERSLLRYGDLSPCLFIEHPHEMRDATTNCGFGGLCDDFRAFLDVGVKSYRLLFGKASECNHS